MSDAASVLRVGGQRSFACWVQDLWVLVLMAGDDGVKREDEEGDRSGRRRSPRTRQQLDQDKCVLAK